MSNALPKHKCRRARDQLVTRDGTDNQTLTDNRRVQNHVMLVDDDLKETAQALGDIEGFLVRALKALENHDISRGELEELATDKSVIRDMEYLGDTLSALKRRLFIIAGSIRG